MVEALVGALLGAAFGTTMAASATFLGFTASTMWVLGASLGSLFAAASFQVATVTPNYSLDPASNTLSGSVPVPVAYGRNRIAGNFFYQQFETDEKKIMYLHCALSEGPIVSGGINFNDIMLNDYTTAELTNVTKELFLGTSEQTAGTYDPEGIAYPNTAYVSLKVEANSKVQGTPVVTTVFQGRDIDYPDKGDTTSGKFIAADNSVSTGISLSNTYIGYKYQTSTATGVGTKRYRVADYSGDRVEYYFREVATQQMSFYSGYYENDTAPHVICIPFTFAKYLSETYTYRITVNGNNFSNIEVPSSVDKPLTRTLKNGMRLYWEPRRIVTSDGITYYSGVIYVKIPPNLISYPGRASITVRWTYYTGSYVTSVPSGGTLYGSPTLFAGLLNYTDILTDSPYGGMFDINGINNPVWCLYDFLTNARYGAGIPEGLIDIESFQTVAGQCDAEGISFNFIIDRHQPILDHISEFLTTFKGWMTVRDKISIGMDAPALAPSALITADDILVGSFSWWETPSDQVSNWITVEYIDGDGENDGGTWERVSVDAIDYEDADKRGIVQASYSLLAINNKAQAEAMANYLLNKSRYGQVFCQFTAMLNRSAIEVGDVIAITYDLPNWTEQWVRVVSIKDAEDGTIGIVCNVYDSRVYE